MPSNEPDQPLRSELPSWPLAHGNFSLVPDSHGDLRDPASLPPNSLEAPVGGIPKNAPFGPSWGAGPAQPKKRQVNEIRTHNRSRDNFYPRKVTPGALYS